MSPPRPPLRIESLQHPLVKELRLAFERRERVEPLALLAEGVITIGEATEAGWIPNLLVHDGSAPAVALRQIIASRVAAERVKMFDEVVTSKQVMAKITGRSNPPSIVARFLEPTHSLEDLNARASERWLMVEGIRDPGNLGNCLRTAAATGAGGVILVGACCDPYSIEVVRASTGSIFSVPIFRAAPDVARRLIAEWPGATVAAMPHGAGDYDTIHYRAPALLVIGAEKEGLSDALVRACSATASIPMVGRTESLNLATAAALMLYASMRAAGSKR